MPIEIVTMVINMVATTLKVVAMMREIAIVMVSDIIMVTTTATLNVTTTVSKNTKGNSFPVPFENEIGIRCIKLMLYAKRTCDLVLVLDRL